VSGVAIEHHGIATPDGVLHAVSSGVLTETPVLLLHGMSSHSGSWIDVGFTDALTRAGRSWIALDVRGHGSSMKLYGSENYQLPALIGDLLALLDGLGLDRVDLVGYSFGGHLAGEFAVAHPDRVRALVLGGFDGGYAPPPEGIEQRLRSHLEYGTVLPSDFARGFWAGINAPGNDPRAILSCFEVAMRDIRPRGARPTLVGYPGPLLVCAGRNDAVAPGIERLAMLTRQGVARWAGDHDHPGALGSVEFEIAVLDFLAQFPQDG
jgi:pimeloyl-ACP methyl ester carboxylesterase